MTRNLRTSWQAMVEEAVALRRELHREPELAWHETGTAARIRAQLDRLGIEWRACAGTGTVATLATGRPGRHIALRADIDALPIEEKSGVEWTSNRAGFMHACGHDGHTATLFAAAQWLKSMENELPGPVSLLFQPAEEGGHGAKRMIEDGALDGVDAIFGWHNWPAIPFGKAVCPDGAVMAGNGTFEIEVLGQGGHASQPDICRDPVLAGSAIVVALQHLISRRLSPQYATVLSVTSFEAPSALTVIPDRAVLRGSFRLGNAGTRGPLSELIEETATATAAAHGCGCEVRIQPRYDATVNHANEAAAYREALASEFGPDVIETERPVPIMASEDFSYYLKEIPGAFALIGAGQGHGRDHPCHSAEYDFNDGLIDQVGRVYCRLAGMPLPETTDEAA